VPPVSTFAPLVAADVEIAEDLVHLLLRRLRADHGGGSSGSPWIIA
jgi:hypothetical protein